jgi:hypothetical protein
MPASPRCSRRPGIHYTSDVFNAAVALAVAVAGLVAVLLPEQKAP